MTEPSRWTYDHLHPKFERSEDTIAQLRIPNTTLLLEVPSSVDIAGPVVVEPRRSTPRAAWVEMRLVLSGHHYDVVSQCIGAIDADAFADEFPEWVEVGVEPTFDIDSTLAVAIRWNDIRRRAIEAADSVVDAATFTRRDELSDTERVALIWHQAALVDADPNVLIAEWFNSNRNAAALRLRRVRQAGLVPPARHGQRRTSR